MYKIKKTHTGCDFCRKERKMKDVRPIIAKNLSKLRKEKGLTQTELAEKMNYSNKAVSRWEQGDTLPDVNVLCELCDFYGITLNDLTNEECEIDTDNDKKKEIRHYKVWRCILASAIIWLIATGVFAFVMTVKNAVSGMWILFVWATPLSILMFLLFGKSILSDITRFILSSSIMWTWVASLYLTILVFGNFNLWQFFLIGAPVELIIFLTYKMKAIAKKQKG